jgi:hypothetical protein
MNWRNKWASITQTYVQCKKLDGQERNSDKKNFMTLYSGHKSDTHEIGTGFYISRHIIDNY